MANNIFVSPEFSMAIQYYLATKDEKNMASLPFLVLVVRTLIYIYGELDIINPYITRNEDNMGGFDSNLTKYGYSLNNLKKFKENLKNFPEQEKNNKKPNLAFKEIEKSLIDMYFCKKKVMSLSNNEELEFQKYLCLSTNTNLSPLLQKYGISATYLDAYFKSKLFESNHDFQLTTVNKHMLFMDAYSLLGYSAEQISKMNENDLNMVNNQVYQFFQVTPTDTNADELLIKAVNYYKRYGNRITSGNGYVDLLLFMSVLSTAIFVVLLMAIHLF